MLALEHGDWIAKEIRRACNVDASAEAIDAVRDWMVHDGTSGELDAGARTPVPDILIEPRRGYGAR
jgi:hypothetical protein